MTETARSSGAPIVIKGPSIVREPGRAVLSAEIVAADLAMPASMWFAVAPRFADGLTTNGDPFLPPTALRTMREHRALRLEDSVSALLDANVRRVMDIHAAWSQGAPRPLRAVQVTARTTPRAERGPTAAAFFSGGADSFYTVLKNQARYPRSDSRAISHLIVVHGLDVALEDQPLFDKVEASATEVAKALGLDLLTVRTNVRSVLHGIDWGQHAHGAALASIALAFSRLFHTVFVPSGSTFFALHSWGSHPGVDPLWSTETCELVHDGADANREHKLQYLAASPLALAHLRVCWKNPEGAYNCGCCEKCLRTMTILEAAGALPLARTFPPRIAPASVRALTIRPDQHHFWAPSLERLRRSQSHRELVAAIGEAIARGRASAGRHRPVGALLRRYLERLGITSARIQRAEQRLLGGALTAFRRLVWRDGSPSA